MTNYDITRLYDRYADRVYRFILVRCGNVRDAQDITSDVFMRVVQAAPQFDYRSAAELQGWLFTIARHCIADHFRNQVIEISVEHAAQVKDFAPLPSELFDLKSSECALLAQIHDLPERMQEIVLLRYQVGLKNKEIAQLLAIEPSSVSAALTKARSILRLSFSSDL